MAKRVGIEGHQEWKNAWVYRDARPFFERLMDTLSHPKTFSIVCIGTGVFGMIFTSLAPVLLFLALLTTLGWYTGGYFRKQLPLQIPQQAGLLDRSVKNAFTKRFDKGAGILYLGNNRSVSGESEECWVNNSEARTHFLIAGTTGSGKTQTLLGMVANALSWGSGGIYVDGKADNSLFFSLYALARRMGREDHIYLLNFMTGGKDVFSEGKSESRRSNTFNPFSRGSADDFIQLMVSLMPQAGGDNAMWQGLAVGMIDAVIRGLCLRRMERGLEIDPGVIRDAIEMNSIIEMAREFQRLEPGTSKYELVFRPIKAYLINLPGLDWRQHVDDGDPVETETKKQHDFRSMQFLRQLTMIADTYGRVFRQQIPEVDMLDIILNNRILVVMIPSMEKSEEESGAVGKLVVTTLRMMMALNLGDHVEGMYDDTVGSKATSSNSPYLCILDELGYYFTKGLAVIFAQARSLGFCMVAAMQDFPALMKGQNKEEAESVIANTKFKEALAMEDSEKTADFFLKTAGKALVTEVSGYSGDIGVGSTNYRDRMDASIQERERVTLQELRDMETAESILMWRDRIVRLSTFTPFLNFTTSAKQVRKFPVRINRMCGVHPPLVSPGHNDLEMFAEKRSVSDSDNAQLLVDKLVSGMTLNIVIDNISAMDMGIEMLQVLETDNVSMTGKDRDLWYFAKLYEHVEEGGSYEVVDKPVVPETPAVPNTSPDATPEGGGELDTIDLMAQLVGAAASGVPASSEPASSEPVRADFTDDERSSEILRAISMAVTGSDEAVIEETLTRTDHVLSSRQDQVIDVRNSLMNEVDYYPSEPPPVVVDEDIATNQVELIMRSLMKDQD